jgi:hypothetical protein
LSSSRVSFSAAYDVLSDVIVLPQCRSYRYVTVSAFSFDGDR